MIQTRILHLLQRLPRPYLRVLMFCFAIIILSAVIVKYRMSHRHMSTLPPPAVSIATATLRDWQPHIQSTGILKASQGIVLKTEIEGRVSKVLFQSGQKVIAGTEILELDQSAQKAALDYAQSQLDMSQFTFERYQKLIHTNAISKDDYDQKFYTFRANQAQVATAQSNLNNTIIKAPFTGWLGLSDIAVGDYLKPGDTIVNLEQLDPLYVDFEIPEKYLSELRKNDHVSISSEAYPHDRIEGQVIARESLVNTDTGSLTLRAAIANPAGKFLPGNFVEVKLYIDAEKKVITVPQTALIYSGEGTFVYKVMSNHTVKLTPVVVGEQKAQSIIVTQGLKLGDHVVSAGTDKVSDGSHIRIRY